RRSMSDFLAALALRRIPAVIPVPPVRKTHFANDAIFDLRAVNGGPGISQRLAGQRDLFIQLGGGLWRLEGDMEFRALVFFDIETRGAGRTRLNRDLHRAHEAITRRGETAGERAIIIATLRFAGDFFAIGIAVNQRDVLPFDQLVIIPLLIHPQPAAVVLEGLAGA